MSVLFDLIYALGLLLALPVLVVKSWRTGKYRTDWAGRFGRIRQSGPLGAEEVRRLQQAGAEKAGNPGKRLMIHCVSVGELLSMRGLVDRLLAGDGKLEIVVTTTTDTGTARAKEVYGADKYAGRVRTYRYPLDFSFAVASFLDAVRPDVIALVELETWPNFVRAAARRGIPICVINGRMTLRSSGRYRLIGAVVRGMFERVAWFGVQTETIAGRFRNLGAPAERIEVVPTIKYDVADLADTVGGAEALARATGIGGEQMKLLVGGSTGPGEEEALVGMYEALRGVFPELRLAIAPRKPETVEQVVRAIGRRGLVAVMRTEHMDGTVAEHPLAANDVLVLDTLGELRRLYSLGFGAFVGRSMVPLGGSDMIEVAALGKPCCFGIYTANFAEVVELLAKEEAAVVVKEPEDLTATVRGWLSRPEAAMEMGRKGREVIRAQRGGTERYARKLLGMLGIGS